MNIKRFSSALAFSFSAMAGTCSASAEELKTVEVRLLQLRTVNGQVAPDNSEVFGRHDIDAVIALLKSRGTLKELGNAKVALEKGAGNYSNATAVPGTSAPVEVGFKANVAGRIFEQSGMVRFDVKYSELNAVHVTKVGQTEFKAADVSRLEAMSTGIIPLNTPTVVWVSKGNQFGFTALILAPISE